MKLCFLAPANSVHSYRWIKYFADKGHEVTWVSLHPATVNRIEGVDIRHIAVPLGSAGASLAALKLRAIMKTRQPDVLHIHSVALYGVVGALCGFRPYVATAWGSDVLNASASWWKRHLVRYALRRASLVTCDAHHMVAAMERLGIDRRAMEMICFGIDTERFCPAGRSGAPSLDWKDAERPKIISLRSFHPVYDLKSLIEAATIVVARVPSARFILAGSGPQEDFLKEMAKSLGLEDNVSFPGPIPNEQLPALFATMDVYVSTALSDAGIAASTAEAMACGLPVVVTDSGENRLWVQDGRGGFVVPTGTPAALAEKILHLIENGETREAFGRINRKTIVEKNNYGTEMAKMEKIYTELARLGRAGRSAANDVIPPRRTD